MGGTRRKARPKAGSAPLGRDAILAALGARTSRVTCPELGGDVLLSALSAADMLRWQDIAQGDDDNTDSASSAERTVMAMATFISLCAVDGGGERLFGPDDVARLGALPFRALERLFVEGLALNGMNGTAVEDMAGN